MSEEKYNLFILLANLCMKLGEAPIKDKMWIHQVDEQWLLAVNGFKDDQETGPFGQSHASHKIPSFYCYVEFNGWPAGEFNPYGGWFAAGDAANTETFSKALQQKIEALDGEK